MYIISLGLRDERFKFNLIIYMENRDKDRIIRNYTLLFSLIT